MNNLHRELAPISDEAWAQIEEEAARTFKRHLAGRAGCVALTPRATAFRPVCGKWRPWWSCERRSP
jgi:uncharacterized linocin/CFP29 family protein